jgi:hypothetical protein
MSPEGKLTAEIDLKGVSRIIVYENPQSAPILAMSKTPSWECLQHKVGGHPSANGIRLFPVGITVDFRPCIEPRRFEICGLVRLGGIVLEC